LAAAFELTRLEGIIPALESAHAVAALEQLELNEKDTAVLCLSGRGDKDMATYMQAMEDGIV
jgi:tryptophan synthase beta chain